MVHSRSKANPGKEEANTNVISVQELAIMFILEKIGEAEIIILIKGTRIIASV